jgi:hypothetical protein
LNGETSDVSISDVGSKITLAVWLTEPLRPLPPVVGANALAATEVVEPPA